MGVCTIKIIVLSTDTGPVVARAYDGPMCRSSSAEACASTTLLVVVVGEQQPAPKAACINAISHYIVFDKHHGCYSAQISQKHDMLQTIFRMMIIRTALCLLFGQ